MSGAEAVIQQAENPASQPQNFTNCGKKWRRRLTRVAFETSRLMEFCSIRELVNQTGHAAHEWPLVVLKELVDNAIDAAEETDIAPAIDISVSGDAITVADNGPGLPDSIIAGILDYTVRVSSREVYASPTRGAQGNALKTILAMAFVLDGESGETLIESRGIAHQIVFKVDQILMQPAIEHQRMVSPVTAGTKISVRLDINDVPRVIEVAFGVAEQGLHAGLDEPGHRKIQGLNWSPGIGDPFRSLGVDGESLQTMLSADLKVGHRDPVISFISYAHPRLQYTDRGKSAVVIE